LVKTKKMADIHDKIKKLLHANGIDWQENNSKLAKGILGLVQRESVSFLKGRVFTTDNMKKGTTCPVCNQHVKLYKVRVNAQMAKSLIKLYKLSRGNTTIFYHHEEIGIENKVGGAWAKLRWWGLIEEQPKDKADKNKRTSGSWRITDKGVKFVEGKLKVAKYVKLYNQSYYGYEGDGVSIIDALGKKFSYSELMGR